MTYCKLYNELLTLTEKRNMETKELQKVTITTISNDTPGKIWQWTNKRVLRWINNMQRQSRIIVASSKKKDNCSKLVMCVNSIVTKSQFL